MKISLNTSSGKKNDKPRLSMRVVGYGLCRLWQSSQYASIT